MLNSYNPGDLGISDRFLSTRPSMASDPENWSVGEERLPTKLGAASAEQVENQLLKGLDAWMCPFFFSIGDVVNPIPSTTYICI